MLQNNAQPRDPEKVKAHLVELQKAVLIEARRGLEEAGDQRPELPAAS